MEVYNEWAEIAERDYDLAKKIFDLHWPKQNTSICFHCQQSAEKYLKAYLAYHNEPIVKTHILKELIEVCVKYDKDFDTLRAFCTYLTPFAVQIRYPDSTFDITDVEAKKALDNRTHNSDSPVNKFFITA